MLPLLRASQPLSAEATLLTAVAGFPATLALPVPDCVMLFIDVEGPSPVPLKPDGRVILMEAVCSTALPEPDCVVKFLDVASTPPPEELPPLLKPDCKTDDWPIAPALDAEPDHVDTPKLIAPALVAEPDLEEVLRLAAPSLVVEPDREDTFHDRTPLSSLRRPPVDASSSDATKTPQSS